MIAYAEILTGFRAPAKRPVDFFAFRALDTV